MVCRITQKNKLGKLHRWPGLIFSLFVFLAAGSGVPQYVMPTRPKPPPKPGPSAAMKAGKFQVTHAQTAALLPPNSSLSSWQ